MASDGQLERIATATAEEILRVIFGDDLEGCTVSLDTLTRVIRSGLEAHARSASEITDLHAKAFEAVQLLSTPPADGQALSPEDLRTLLGERLDKIQTLSTKVLTATKAAVGATDSGSDINGPAA
jgi:hypothetical protein